MLITELQLKNFRNLNFNIKPAAGFNLIVGENGAGKSNLLDAIYHLALVKTFKPYSLKNNINFANPSDFALIRSTIDNDEQFKELKIIFALDTKNTNPESEPSEQKRLELNTKSTTRSKFIHNLYVILFAPHNINLLIGTPDLRRAELDDFASICDYKYASYINDYKEVVRNRNRVLKAIFEGKAQAAQLNFWDAKLIQLGSFITLERKRILDILTPQVVKLAATHFKGELKDLNIVYHSRILQNFEGKEANEALTATYRDLLMQNRDKEIYSRQSQYGPHKDDFDMLSGGRDLKLFGSRGQQRIVSFLFKLAMWHYLAELKTTKPVILLDDIMSELDNRNRLLLEEIIQKLQTQTFITTTHLSDYSEEFRKIMLITQL